MQELVRSQCQEDPLEEGMATHSTILDWRISWTEKPGGSSPWGNKESDMTEATEHIRVHICTYMHIITNSYRALVMCSKHNVCLYIYICICIYVCVLIAQSCPTLCDPMGCSLQGSSVRGILQARILK